jgi:hypothetical protein
MQREQSLNEGLCCRCPPVPLSLLAFLSSLSAHSPSRSCARLGPGVVGTEHTGSSFRSSLSMMIASRSLNLLVEFEIVAVPV